MAKEATTKQATKMRTTPTHDDDPILTYTDAAKMLGKHRSTLSRSVSDGLLRAGRMPSGLPGICKSEIDKVFGILVRDTEASQGSE